MYDCPRPAGMDDDSRRVSRRRLLGGLGAAATFGLAGCAESDDPEGRTLTDVPPTTTYDGDFDVDRQDEGSPYTDVYRATIDSVTSVRVFRDLGRGGGSGFAFDDDGHFVTNQHVVADANGIEVRFARGDWRDGEVVATDVYSDLAVIRVDDPPEYADPLTLLEGDPPIGTEVVALGNPFNFAESVSAGIVSGVDRSLPGVNNFRIADVVQFDAAANPGNSGGPLVTLDGRVVGAVTAGQGNDVNFAVSAAVMRRVIPALIEDGEYDHPYVGVTLLGVSPSVADANDLEQVRGVLIADVLGDGPADGVLQGSDGSEEVNGVEVPVGGDVILEMAGQPIPTQDALSTFLALNTSPGDTVPTVVLRDGERTEVALELGVRPPPTASAAVDDGLVR